MPTDPTKTVAILGTGTIGASWASYFLANGLAVKAWDPAPDGHDRLRQFVEDAWPAMEQLGLKPGADPTRITWHDDPRDAVADVPFVQENAPEDLALKRDLLKQLDGALGEKTVLASSTSGLLMSDIQAGFASADRLVVGHPFNPPHLIPLVEVVGGRETEDWAIDFACDFYTAIGKKAIRVNHEIPGHIANRLQAAMQREAIHLVSTGAASAADVDAAVAFGPGLRWAIMGPMLTFHLAGGKGGIEHAIEHFGPALESWWQDLGSPTLDEDTRNILLTSVRDMLDGKSLKSLEQHRDARLIDILKSRRDRND